MTPAIDLAKQQGIAYTVHHYQHDPAALSYGLEAAEKLGVKPEQVFKTLVVQLEGKQLAVAVLPVNQQLSMKLLAKALGAKKAEMANAHDVMRSTGYVLGGVSPLGQKKPLPTVIDSSAQQFERIFVSAGKRGLEIELSGTDLCRLLNGRMAALCQL
ncbi:MAG: Cys-tRNA(Pro) deacylase [Gammaproteobacteria bacterium]|nr:Cys-tRNA(Pro) deacylase [Gammaproteobacteria bacterium]MBU1556628.1 Cys-tRNA(Pro) deacylase [Gammaproteobacteria bacterium]MBU2069783.1 Cys-tRNA(Pro) deacylase [Gammaproteobacteria bacterium]MBU2184648.1 Cys-tRNA(Pro) deacylase [Gammaproteobacteria bacterium]MBU2205686.1 Cys-tRNA(Pro) deacylase [Gammaproteobacteria bacterium]